MGKWVDQVIMRITDTWLALPALMFAIFMAAVIGPSETNIIIILGAVYWTRYARVIRGEVLSLKERDFVRLAIVAGCSKRTIMLRHMLPNVLNSAIVIATLMLGVVIITEATLSFLGVGVPPPKPAWGLMLADGKKGLMAGYWWLTVLPGSLHHAHGALRQPPGGLASREARSAAPPTVKLLEVDGLSTHYITARGTRVTRAVQDVSFTLDAGETLGIVGESGSGKTTLALTLLRLLPPGARIVGGSIRFEGEDLVPKSEAEMRHIRGKRMAMILQDPMASLNPLFTIGDQVAEPIRIHEHANRRSARDQGARPPGRRAHRRSRPSACGSTRTSSPGGCASASWAPSPSPASLVSSSPTSRLPAWTSPSRPSTWPCCANCSGRTGWP